MRQTKAVYHWKGLLSRRRWEKIMEAKEEIYQYIKENHKEGVTAQDISEVFEIKRNVASHYLNRLEKEGKLQKGTTRPVCFSVIEKENRNQKEVGNVESRKMEEKSDVSTFSNFIGSNGSMEQIIEKCKAGSLDGNSNRKDPETKRIIRNNGKGRSGAFIILFKRNSLE